MNKIAVLEIKDKEIVLGSANHTWATYYPVRSFVLGKGGKPVDMIPKEILFELNHVKELGYEIIVCIK